MLLLERTIIVVVAFAAGVLARDIAQDWRDLRYEKIKPAPIGGHYTPRPRCPGEWIVKQADGGKVIVKCLRGTRT